MKINKSFLEYCYFFGALLLLISVFVIFFAIFCVADGHPSWLIDAIKNVK